jgi:HK97 family phage major capsid protein
MNKKLAELLERRAAAVDTMKANEDSGGKAFDDAKGEFDTLTIQIERAKVIDAADRTAQGEAIGGGTRDAKLETELRGFSIRAALAGAAGMEVEWGRERELQAELATRAGKKAQGVYIPTEAFERRATTSADGGSFLVPTDHRADLYISALTAASVVRSMGATVLTGLTGDVDIPREVAAPNTGWFADNGTIPGSDAEFGSISLTPRHVGSITQYSRNMLLQSSPQIETLLRSMMARDLALAIDAAAIMGGGSHEPTGVLSTSGIQTEAYGATLMDTTAEMIAKADIANVEAKRSFLSTPGVRKLAMLARDGNDLAIPLAMQFHNEPHMFSNQVPTILGAGDNEHGLIYGDWTELLIGIWSEIDVLVNPYETSAYAKGNVSIRAIATADVNLRHRAAFVSATGVTVA